MNDHSRHLAMRTETAAPERQKRGAGSDYAFLVSTARSPCGVEAFARQLESAASEAGIGCALAASDGSLGQTLHLANSIAAADTLIVNLPLVAWKRKILGSWATLLLARIKGVQPVLVLHEWADLDWRRRVVMSTHVLLAKELMFSAPLVAAQFDRSLAGRLFGRKAKSGHRVLPIPPNVRRPAVAISSPLAQELLARKAEGRMIIGQFGSIYPKKQSMRVLDIAAELKRRGHPVHVVFIGSFIKASDNLESDFWARARELGMAGDVQVTGYIQSAAELFAAFDQVDGFVYDFVEGLSSRRGSVLACLQSGRPVVVNEPAERAEFDHHAGYIGAIEQGALRFVPLHATVDDFADALLTAVGEPAHASAVDFDACWADTVSALARTCPALS